MGKKSILLPFTLFIVACSDIQDFDKPINYDYDLIADYQIKWNDIFKQNKEDYYLYFYSPTCGYCDQIKNDVISYFLNNKDDVYFVVDNDDFVIGSDASKTIGVDNIDSFFILGTPSLVEISDGKVTLNIAGVKNIKEYLF